MGKPVVVAGEEGSEKSGSPLRGVDVGRPLVPSMFESVLAGFNPNRMRQGHRSRWGGTQQCGVGSSMACGRVIGGGLETMTSLPVSV